MSNLFIAVANMSVTASFAALVVILVRLLIRRTPKVFSYALWSVVLFRMVCPVSFESALSLLPGNPRAIPQSIVFSPNPAVETGVPSIDNAVNRAIGGSLPPVNPAASANPMGIVMEIAAIIWLLGMAALLWISYFLMVKDMEMSCDESVMRQTNGDSRLGYSDSLLRLSVRQSGLISPLAFGESSVKSRIRNVLNYKKPRFWVTALAVVLVAAAAVGLAANPGGYGDPSGDTEVNSRVQETVEEKIGIMLSSPKESSNPQDYIDAHWKEYEGILKLGSEALDYLLAEFEKGVENDLRGHIMMRLCKEMLGPRQSTADDTLPPREWYLQLTIHEETRLPDFAYDGDDPIERLVYATEAEMNKNPYRGGFVVAAPKIHAYYEMGGVLKVFVTTYSVNYHLYDKVLSRDGGGIVPAAITYVKDNRGEYKLEEYKQTLDGAYFGQSIRDFCTMPVSGERIEGLAELILAHYSDCDDIRDLHRENLIKHLKANNQTGVKLRMHSGSETPLT
jgi:bla regulator protein BlaR1